MAAVRAIMRRSLGFDADTLLIAEEMADAVEACHPTLIGRSRRVAELAQELAQALEMSADDRRRVYLAARLHDIGAALQPAHVLLESDMLDEQQRAYRRNHPEEAAKLVGGVLRLYNVAESLRFHHERFDGRGPQGTWGWGIPIDARILAVCEAWVGLVSATDYRPALTELQALLVMNAGAGTQWDPDLVKALAGMVQPRAQAERSLEAIPAAMGMRLAAVA
jgi:HD-GYP domain-containing protein (c-di-GMP phosphodiesterase class II)